MEYNTIYLGKRQVNFRLPDEIPPLDQEQIDAAKWMVNSGNALLFSDPGAGKTLTALQGLMSVQMETDLMYPVIVVCPSIAVRTWAVWYSRVMMEINMVSKVQILTGNSDTVMADATCIIVTYGTLGRKNSKALEQLKQWDAALLICDESDNMAGVDSQRTQSVLGAGGLAHVVPSAWFLTGTPIPRYADGLWPVLNACFPQRLHGYGIKSKAKFIETFCVERLVKYGHMRFPTRKIVGNKNKDLLNALLYDDPGKVAWRNKLKIRSKPIFHDLTLDLKPSKELKELQKQVDAEAPMQTDAFGNPVYEVNPVTQQALHLYGKELVPHVAEVVTDLLRGVEDGILVLFWHKEVGKALQSAIIGAGYSCARIDGSTVGKARDNIVDGFNDGEFRVMLGQIKTMGVALNLQENCHTVVFAEDTYSDAANLQAYQRVWRRGQTQNVNIYRCKTTLGLSDLRLSVADRKGSDAAEILDK